VRYWVTLITKQRGNSQWKVPDLFPMVASGFRTLWHLEVGARVPDHRTSTNHSPVEPDR